MNQSTSFRKQVIRFLLIVFLVSVTNSLIASRVDSLRNAIAHGQQEANRLHAMCLLALELMPKSMKQADSLLVNAAALPEIGTVKQVSQYYNYRGLYYWYAGNREESIAQFRKTLALQETPSTLHDRAMAANNIGGLYRQLGMTDSALVYLRKALDIDIRRNHQPGIAKTRYDMAVLYDSNTQYHLALMHILDAISYQQEVSDTAALVYSYNVLGNIYSRIDSIAKAAHYYKEGLKLAEYKKMDKNTISYYNNLISLMVEEPDSLLEMLSYFQKGTYLASEHNDYRNHLAIHGNIARAYDAAHEQEMASTFFRMGLNYLEKADNMSTQARFLFHYGNHLYKKGQIREAVDFLRESHDYAQRANDASTQSKVYALLASIDSDNGNFRDAYQNHRRSVAIRDSIYSAEKSARIAEVLIMHNIHDYRMQLVELQNESRFNRLRYVYSLISVLSVVFLLSFSVIYFRKRKGVAEKNLIIKELEHANLQTQFKVNRQELTGKALLLMNSERLIKSLQRDLKAYIDQADDGCRDKLQSVTRMLNTEDKTKELWKEFENRFNELSGGFIARLTEAHPDLSPSEIRMCAMLRLQMSSKEISKLSQRALRTVEQSRFKIRKKIGLKPGENLVTYLLNHF